MPVGTGAITLATLTGLTQDFHEKHRMTYGHASPHEPVQLVNLRVAAVGRLDGLALGQESGSPSSPGPAATSRMAYFSETGLVRCDVLPRMALALGFERAGPLIVEAVDTTIVVPPGWRLRADPGGVILLELADDG